MMINVRKYEINDIDAMVEIWNEVVDDGIAFPQLELLDHQSGTEFFDAQTYCGVAENEDGEVVGMYILHPNNIGRAGHIGNASYAVRSGLRGLHIGEKLVKDSLAKAKFFGFGVMQFNAVVASNVHALNLYERVGFVRLGTIPRGFKMKDGHFEDIVLFYYDLT